MKEDELTQEFINMSKENIRAITEMTQTLKTINDFNVLHAEREKNNYDIVDRLVTNNEKFYKLFSLILLMSFGALAILAGIKSLSDIIPGI